MLKHLFLALVLAASTAPLALADGSFDLSGYQTGVGSTLQGANAQVNFNFSGDPAQWNTPQFQANIQAPQVQLQVQAQPQNQDFAVTESQPSTASASGGAAASGGTTGTFGNTSNATGSGPSGMGGLTTSATGQQSACSLPTGTMGLAPVFGYGGGAGGLQSPGGYVSGIQLPFGLGTVRVPSVIGLPGGGAIGLPQINNNTINNLVGN